MRNLKIETNMVKKLIVMLLALLVSTASAGVVNTVADLDLSNVVKAINFGTTTDQAIGGVTFLAADINTTVDGVTNLGGGANMSGMNTNEFPGGNVDSVPTAITNTGLKEIYGSSIYARTIDIDIPLADGLYLVQMLYYDVWNSPIRSIAVTAESELMMKDYDQWIEQGSIFNSASVAKFTVNVTDGNLDISQGVITAGQSHDHLAGLIISQPTNVNIPAPDNGQQLLEDDWFYQAGETLDLKDIENEIRWTHQIANRYSGQTANQVQSKLKQLSNLEDRFKTFSSVTPAEQVRNLYIAIRQVKRAVLLLDPALDFDSIVFIDNEYPIAAKLPENQSKRSSLFFQSEWNHQSQHRNGFMAVPGGRLLRLKGLHPSAEIQQLAPTTQQTEGSFLRPDISFDGKKVLFSFKPAEDNSYHLYEMNLDGLGLKQLTDSVYDDNDPIYLPDGHIMFTSTRGNTTVRCMRYSWSSLLSRCDADGKNVYILSRNNEPDWLPSLLSDGRVVYTRWEYTEKNVMRVQGLWTVDPDGTKPEVLWGNMSVWPDHLASPRQIPGTSQIMFSGVGHHLWHNGSIGIVDPAKGREYPNGLTKVTPDVKFAEVGDGPVKLPIASKDYHSAGVWGSYKTPYPLSKDLMLVSIYKGDINTSTFPGYFQLYLMDMDGNRELVYKGKYNIFHAMPVKLRVRPFVKPSVVQWPGTGKNRKPNVPGFFYSTDVYEGTTIPKGTAKHLRVIQLDYKTHTPWRQSFGGGGPNRIPLAAATYPSASSKRILGTVPVSKEGVVYFQAPSGIPLMLQLLDDEYRCIQTMRSFTGVMPGEIRGCVGCHEKQTNSPRNAAVLRNAAAKIVPPPWGTVNFSYERMIQPIFDKHCISCHGDSDNDACRKLDLRFAGPSKNGANAQDFSDVYFTLIGPGRYGLGMSKMKNYTGAIDISMGSKAWHEQGYSTPFEPMTFFSYNSLLLQTIATDKQNHGDLKLEKDELRMLTAWMDINSPYRGDDELRLLPDPEFEGIENIVPRPRIKTSPIIMRP